MSVKYHASLVVGEYYYNAGGGCYECLERINADCYIMINAQTGWKFLAHVITMHDDGTIEWDWSSEGHFYE